MGLVTLKRPAVPVFISIAIGIALGEHALRDTQVPVLATLVFLFAVAAFLARENVALSVTSLILGVASLGILLVNEREQAFDESSINRLAQLRPKALWVEGQIASNPVSRTYGLDFNFKTSRVFLGQDTLLISGPVLVSLTLDSLGTGIALPERGDVVRAKMRLDPIEGPRNPHEHSYLYRVKEQEACFATGWISSRFDYYVLTRGEKSVVYSWLESARRVFDDPIEAYVRDPMVRPFVSAIVLGDRAEMDRDLREEFKRAGLAHLLAVSGFNVALVAFLIVSFLRLIGVARLHVRVVISTVAIFFYCGLVGFQPSVLRAMIMIECYLLAKLLERKADPINILFAAATLDLIFRPYDLFDAGFQLSYGCVFGLIFLIPRFAGSEQSRTGLEKVKRALREIALGSSVATLVTMPILAYHFGTLGIAGLFTNVVAIPLVSFITAVGFLLAPLSLFSNYAAMVYGDGITILSKLLFSVVKASAAMDLAQFTLVQYSLSFVLVLSAGVLVLLSSRDLSRLLLRSTQIASLGLIMFGSGFMSIRKTYLEESGKLSVFFFDVGQGDCILISTPGQKNYFIDFGGTSHLGRRKIERSAMNFLEREGIEKIEAGFITHLHADHYAGLARLAQNVEIKQVLTSGERITSSLASELDRTVHARSIPVHNLQRGQVMKLDRGVSLYILNPDSALRGSSENLNHTSLALKLVYGNTSALLLGDIEAEDERRIVREYGSFLRSDIVKVAHHGSKTSSCPELISHAAPQDAVISVGSRNSFGHPAREVKSRWRSAGVRMDRTDKEGALLFRSDGRTMQKVDWRSL